MTGLVNIIGVLYLMSFIGLIISSVSCYRLYDLKKIVAFSSIIHLNMGFASLVSFSIIGLIGSVILAISHGLSSVGLFLFVGFVGNRTFTRYYDSLFFLDSSSRVIFFILVLCSLSFPSLLSFISELLSFVAIGSISFLYTAIAFGCSFISALF